MWTCNFNSFITLGPPEDDADASKHIGLLTVYKILLIYICVVHLLLCTTYTVRTLKCHWVNRIQPPILMMCTGQITL